MDFTKSSWIQTWTPGWNVADLSRLQFQPLGSVIKRMRDLGLPFHKRPISRLILYYKGWCHGRYLTSTPVKYTLTSMKALNNITDQWYPKSFCWGGWFTTFQEIQNQNIQWLQNILDFTSQHLKIHVLSSNCLVYRSVLAKVRALLEKIPQFKVSSTNRQKQTSHLLLWVDVTIKRIRNEENTEVLESKYRAANICRTDTEGIGY